MPSILQSVGSMPARDRTGQLAVAAAIAVAVAVLGCGGTEPPRQTGAVRPDRPEHVHGLGVNPRDGALVIATHSGLWRLGPGEPAARRIGDLRQDTMGFTVVGPDRFLGSGHPDARTGDPAQLGLIASRDGGRSWRARSLSGDADLHVLTAGPGVLYAVDALSGRLLASGDEGRSWVERRSPGDVVSLAVDPDDPRRLVASTAEGLQRSTDGAATWSRVQGRPGLLTWPRGGALHRVGTRGVVTVSDSAGTAWDRRGDLGTAPAAVTADGDDIHVADAEGRILGSSDGGRTWKLRAAP